MSFQKFLRAAVFLSVLIGVFLNTSLYGMDDLKNDGEDERARLKAVSEANIRAFKEYEALHHAPYETLEEAIRDEGLVTNFIELFWFQKYPDPRTPSVSYFPSLLGRNGDRDKIDMENFFRDLGPLKSGVNLYDNGIKIGDKDLQLKHRKDGLFKDHLGALNSFRFADRYPPKLDGATFLVRRSTDSCVVGVLVFEDHQFKLATLPSFSLSERQQMEFFFSSSCEKEAKRRPHYLLICIEEFLRKHS